MSKAQINVHVSLSFKERHVLCCIAKGSNTFGAPSFSVAVVTDSILQFFDPSGKLTYYLCGDDAQEEVSRNLPPDTSQFRHHGSYFAFFDNVLLSLNSTDGEDIFETGCTSARWVLPHEDDGPPASKILSLLQNLVRYVLDSATTNSCESCSWSPSDTYRVTCIVSAVLSTASHVLLRYSVAKALGKSQRRTS